MYVEDRNSVPSAIDVETRLAPDDCLSVCLSVRLSGTTPHDRATSLASKQYDGTPSSVRPADRPRRGPQSISSCVRAPACVHWCVPACLPGPARRWNPVVAQNALTCRALGSASQRVGPSTASLPQLSVCLSICVCARAPVCARVCFCLSVGRSVGL